MNPWNVFIVCVAAVVLAVLGGIAFEAWMQYKVQIAKIGGADERVDKS